MSGCRRNTRDAHTTSLKPAAPPACPSNASAGMITRPTTRSSRPSSLMSISRAAREMLIRELGRELLVVGLVIIPADALLGHAGGAAGFKDVVWASLVFRRHPDIWLELAQPFILKVRESCGEVGEGFDFLPRVPAGLPGPIEPEWAARFRREMPGNDLAHVGVELVLSSGGCGGVEAHLALQRPLEANCWEAGSGPAP